MILRKIIFLLIAILFLPPSWAITKILIHKISLKLRNLPFDFSPLNRDLESTLLFLGVLLFLLLYRFYKFEFLHTFLHEFTHLIFGVLFLKRIIRFKVSKFKGEVVLSGTNPVILLSPYFFPLLSFLLLLIGFLIANLLNYNLVWFVTIILVGFSLMLHIVMNLKSLMVKQSDITTGGYFFSLIVIYFLFLSLISGIIIFVIQGSMETFSFYNLLFLEIKKSFYLFPEILFNLE